MNFKFFDSSRKTFFYLMLISFAFIVIMAFLLFIVANNYFTCHSDDFLQYFAVSRNFCTELKSGNLSLYSYDTYLGSSFFSDAYYIPFDIFTIITLVLDTFFQFEMAFGLTELLKLFFGTMLLAYYLKMRGFKNKSLFFVCLIYLVCGYNTVMMALPCYFSLVFYLPFMAICLEYFVSHKKKWLLPLAVGALVFFNFYAAYTTLVFTAFLFVLNYLIDNKFFEKLKLPSKEDVDSEEEPSNQIETKDKKIKIDKEIIKARTICLLKYFGVMALKGLEFIGFVLIGVLIGVVVLYPTALFILNDTYRATSGFQGGVLSYTKFENYHYFRILAELFTPNYSTGFYGFNQSYLIDHQSLYITTSGLILFFSVFFLKDRTSWIYKCFIMFEVVLLIFPIVYMVFSGNTAAYVRWFGMINFINLLVLAHVMDKNNLLDQSLRPVKLTLLKNILVIILIIITISFYTSTLYGFNIFEVIANLTGFDAIFFGFKFSTANYGSADFCNVLSTSFSGSMSVIWEAKALPSLTTAIIDDSVVDLVMMCVAIIIIIAVVLFSLQKKFNVIPYILFVELVVAAGFMFVPKFTVKNKISSSEQRDELNAYLDKYTKYTGEYYRTFVDSSAPLGEEINLAKTSLHLTNMRMFHSFMDKNVTTDESNVVDYVDLIYNSNEGQAGRTLINNASLYSNQLLGTKYVVVGKDVNKSVSRYYKHIEKYDTDKYKTYEIENYTPFMIYESYTTSVTNEFKLARESVLLNSVYYNGDYTLPISNYKYTETIKREYVSSSYWKYQQDVFTDYSPYIYYDISQLNIPNEGILYFKLSDTDDLERIFIVDEDNNKIEGYEGYFYCSSKPKRVYILNSSEVVESRKNLIIEYSDYSAYEMFTERMTRYYDLDMYIDGNELDVSYSRLNKYQTNVLAIPVCYNDSWDVIDSKYKVINVNGGFIGVVVPPGEENISFTLKFTPAGYQMSGIASGVVLILYGGMVLLYSLCLSKKWEKQLQFEDVL